MTFWAKCLKVADKAESDCSIRCWRQPIASAALAHSSPRIRMILACSIASVSSLQAVRLASHSGPIKLCTLSVRFGEGSKDIKELNVPWQYR
jgi:hypothetical protein